MSKQTKFVFVTGGVVSSLGKGLVSASIGALMENRGLRVANIKLDPYLNVDAGTMNPFQHGEVFVTDDGAETDLDLGHYERFVSTPHVGAQQRHHRPGLRHGHHQGARAASTWAAPSRSFPTSPTRSSRRILALRRRSRSRHRRGRRHGRRHRVAAVPRGHPPAAGRAGLAELGLGPRHAAALPAGGRRAQDQADPALGRQAARDRHPGRRAGVPQRGPGRRRPAEEDRHVLQRRRSTRSSPRRTSDTIYQLPIVLSDQGLDDKLSELLNIWSRAARLTRWEELVRRIRSPARRVSVAFVGKYVQLVESYKSLNEALMHGGVANDVGVDINHIDAEEIEQRGAAERSWPAPTRCWSRPASAPAAPRARSPRSATPASSGCRSSASASGCSWRWSSSPATSAASTRPARRRSTRTPTHAVVDLMPDQRGITDKGATMRLGAYPCTLVEGTRARAAYGSGEIQERHRHRWEVNNNYRDTLERHGLVLSGMSPDGRLVEMVELPEPPVLCRLPVPPRVQVAPARPAPAVRHIHPGRGRPRDPEQGRRHQGPRWAVAQPGRAPGRQPPVRLRSLGRCPRGQPGGRPCVTVPAGAEARPGGGPARSATVSCPCPCRGAGPGQEPRADEPGASPPRRSPDCPEHRRSLLAGPGSPGIQSSRRPPSRSRGLARMVPAVKL